MGKQINATTAVVIVVAVVLVIGLIGWKVMAKKGTTADPEADEAKAKAMAPGMSDSALDPGAEVDPKDSPPGG